MTATFATIVADPPWRTHSGVVVGREGFGDSRGAPNRPVPYPTMKESEISELPIAHLAAPAAHLWIWTTNGYVEAGFRIMRAWGFTYSTTHVWAKNPMGGGLGESFGITTEFLLFGRRGRAPMRNRYVGTWHNWTRPYRNGHPDHSAKPPESYALVEHCSHGPFVELFSREDQPRLGWSYWGNESLATASIEVAR